MMNPSIRMQFGTPRLLAALIGLAALTVGLGLVQATPVGGTATNFTVTNRATGQPLKLTDFAGKILVLDFFAYWCGPCQESSPKVETEIQKYYEGRGGNAFGVPVQVLAVSIDSSSPSQTDAFVAAAKLELVGEDSGTSAGAWSQFNMGFIPHFVIINGVAGSPSHTQWKVLYSNYGYPGSTTLRSVIDTVKAGTVMAAEIAVEQPSGSGLTDGSASIDFGRVALGAAAAKTFTIKNLGGADLTGLALTRNGTHAADFSVGGLGTTTLTPGASATFTVTFAPAAAGVRRAAIHLASNDADENPFDIDLIGNFDLAEAIEQPGLAITNGGTSPWLAQTTTTHDGQDAARSGAISDNQESWMQATLTGPGTLTYWCKVSSESNYDFLEFHLDGVLQSGRISGEVNWQQISKAIPAGQHTVKWRYLKDASFAGGQDGSWIDEVNFVPNSLSPVASWLLAKGYPATTNPLDDPNGDGVNLLLAYALNLEPALNLRASLPRPVLVANQLTLSFYAGSQGVTYAVESSTDLQSWSTAEVTLSAPDTNNFRAAKVAATPPGRFLRLTVALP